MPEVKASLQSTGAGEAGADRVGLGFMSKL
jgi:hypothetical protein